MEENNLEEKKSSKDIWLILIFVDIIALCVFGYFIFTSFANNGKKQIQINHDIKTEDVTLEEIDLSDPEEQTAQAPVQEIKQEVKQEIKQQVQEIKNQIKQEAAQNEPKEIKTAEPAEKQNQVSKKSVIISGSGKWRKVTFRYFDEAKDVSIVSGFTMAKPSPLKKVNGIWETTLTISPGTYRYMFIVNGKEIKDPYNKQESNGRSLIAIK